jgi:hypothetical protein
MPLFEEPKKPISGGRRGGISFYEYCRDSDRADISERKKLLEKWCRIYPARNKEDLKARFQNKRDEQHMGAMWELVLY